MIPPLRARARFLSLAPALLLLRAMVAAQPVDFPNAGFEDDLASWFADHNDQALGLSQARPDAARSGSRGLRVAQKEGMAGSWLQSSRLSVVAGQAYRLEFWARAIEPSAIGVWVQFFDEDRRQVKSVGGGEVAIQLQPAPSDWTAYRLDFRVPPGAAWVTLAVHGHNKRAVLSDFDDFAVTRIEASAAAPPRIDHPLVPDPARVREIAASLPEVPRGVGPSIDDRAAWSPLIADVAQREKIIARAVRFMAIPTPEVTDEAYRASVESGDRKVDQSVDLRRFRLVTFVIAEGMENQGRFLPLIEKEIAAICGETSWILSGHVKFTFGRNDLGTAMTAWNLAAADTMLGERIPPHIRRLIRTRVKERVWDHYLAVLRGRAKPEWWSIDPNNWNSVVHGGIVASALALLESREERAEIVAGAELGIRFYLKAFPSDGYSPEGMGYWNYGFGHYVLLAETVFAGTGGRINLYSEASRLVAQFPRRFAIQPGVYPAYGDALFLVPPSRWLEHVVDRRYGLDAGASPATELDPMYGALVYAYAINLAFDPRAAPLAASGGAVFHGHRLRDWFAQSQVYVGRPPEGAEGLGVSFKGGDNGVSHGHNDLGVFVVVSNGHPVIADPGVAAYNARTFGPDRYGHQALNSYGHSVPVVAGRLQERGGQYASVMKSENFSDEADTVVLDLTRAYPVPSLLELTRRYDYVRADGGSLTITDRAVFAEPQTFGTALVTYGEAHEEKPGVWLVTFKGQTLRAEISTANNLPFTVTDEVLRDEARFGKIRRLGINLDAPSAEAGIEIKIRPAAGP